MAGPCRSIIHGCSAQETLSLIAQQRARMRLFLVKDGTCRRHKLGRLVVVHGGLDIRMSGKGLNAFKAGSTACELCETAMAKPVRRNVASGDDKGRPFLDESIQPVPRDGASSVAEVFKDRILRSRCDAAVLQAPLGLSEGDTPAAPCCLYPARQDTSALAS